MKAAEVERRRSRRWKFDETYRAGLGRTAPEFSDMISSSIHSETDRGPWAMIFEHVIAEESRLAATTRHYGWLVRGSPWQSLRRLFAEQGRQIDRWRGELIAQARTIGGSLGGGGEERIEEAGEAAMVPAAAVKALLVRHEQLTRLLRRDMSTLDVGPEDARVTTLTQLLEFHETTAWMLRLLIETPGMVGIR